MNNDPEFEAAQPESSLPLLQRWHAGDESALAELLELHRPWLHTYVRRRLGDHLRGVQDSEDVVQEALVSLLRSGPRFVPENEAQFRALIGCVVRNCIQNLSDHVGAARRDRRRTIPIGDLSISFVGSSRSPTRPDERAQREEEAAHLRLALELVDPADKELLVMRDWERMSFADVAKELGIEEKAANKRYHRALLRAGRMTRKLQIGDLDELIKDVQPFVAEDSAAK